MKIEIAPRALREAERCARWWRENRPAAPDLFEEELREALDQIRNFPQLGSAYEAVPGREHRRLLMPETRYHVYYRVAAPWFESSPSGGPCAGAARTCSRSCYDAQERGPERHTPAVERKATPLRFIALASPAEALYLPTDASGGHAG